MATLTRIANWDSLAPVFRCAECGDLMVHAKVASSGNSFDRLHMIGEVDDQKPSYCPSCGAKNKAEK